MNSTEGVLCILNHKNKHFSPSGSLGMQPSVLWALTAHCVNASLVFPFHRKRTIPGIHLTRIYPHIHALSDNTLLEILLSKATLTLGWWLNQMIVMQSQGECDLHPAGYTSESVCCIHTQGPNNLP